MKPAAFLDRDGVICEYVDYLHRLEDFQLRPKVAEAVRTLNKNNYYVFIITNQPMIAKGLLTLEQLDLIHQQMKADLKKEEAYIDAIEYCPHSPDGTISPWNIECTCRKPKTGMIEKLCSQFEVDLKNSFLAGDTWRDIQCAQQLQLVNYGIKGGAGFPYPMGHPHSKVCPDILSDSLWDAVQHRVYGQME